MLDSLLSGEGEAPLAADERAWLEARREKGGALSPQEELTLAGIYRRCRGGKEAGASRKRKHVTIYTDGSSKGNPGPGGYGTVMMFGKHRKELSQGYRKTTNNRMELMAAIAGLEALQEPCEVTIYTDSRYVAQPFQDRWIAGWKRRGWRKADKKEVKNRDLWERLDALASRHEVHWKWVRGHAGNRENERCDFLATEAASGSNQLVDEGFRAESSSRLSFD